MASACVNNIGMPPENILECTPVKCPSYGWLSPRISLSREFPDDEASKAAPSEKSQPESSNPDAEEPEGSDPEISGKDIADFEFRLEDPVKMLPADELFFDGKLMPLHQSTIRQSMTSAPEPSHVKLVEAPKFRLINEISSTDPHLFSPKVPSCSSHWKELFGLRKLYQNSNGKQEVRKTASELSSHNHKRNAVRSVKDFLRRGSKSGLDASVDSSLSLPLLKESDNESVSISSRLSLSSSSSGHEHDDLPRLSLDSDKASVVPRNTHQLTGNLCKARAVKHRAAPSPENPPPSTRAGPSPMRRTSESAVPTRDVSVESPRMISSGKIVFHGLERSSSSPSTFNGGPRSNYRGMERSYSANVCVTPVINVPVCSLRASSKYGVFGIPLFSSQPKKDTGNSGGANKSQQQHHNKNRTNRTREGRFFGNNA